MKFTILVKNKDEPDSKAWKEDYEENTTNPLEFARNVIDRWNKTLRPHEKARVLLGIQSEGTQTRPKHDWHKVNQVTVVSGGGTYDVYQCSHCGITGKRFGLQGEVRRDIKYKPKVYNRCDTSKQHLELKRLKEK